jgi:hypothetical protein
MKHTAVILSVDEQGHTNPFVQKFDNKRDLDMFLRENLIHRHPNQGRSNNGFVENGNGDSILVFRGEPMEITFQETFKL